MGCTPPSRFVLQRQVAIGPASSPEANGVGVQMHLSPCLGVREERLLVQEEDQGSPLPPWVRHGTLPPELLGLFEPLGGENGVIERRGTRHGTPPGAKTVVMAIQSPLSVPKKQAWATLQLFLNTDH